MVEASVHAPSGRRRAEQGLQALNVTLESQVTERTRELEEAGEALRQSQKLEAIGRYCQLTAIVAAGGQLFDPGVSLGRDDPPLGQCG